MEKINN